MRKDDFMSSISNKIRKNKNLDIKMSIKFQCSNCKNEKLISREIIQNLDEKTFKYNPIFKCNKCNIRMYPITVEVDY